MPHVPACELAECIALLLEADEMLRGERPVGDFQRLCLAAAEIADGILRLPAVGRHDVGERLREWRERREVGESLRRDELEERRQDIHVPADARRQHIGCELAVIHGKRRQDGLPDGRLPPLRHIVLIGQRTEGMVARDDDEAVREILFHPLGKADQHLVGIPDARHAAGNLFVTSDTGGDLRRVLHHAREIEAVFLVGHVVRAVVRGRIEEMEHRPVLCARLDPRGGLL